MPPKPLIAIIDDDQSVRDGTMDLIEAFGFAAVPLSRADDFLQSSVLESTVCLIADVQMPGKSGMELHNRLVNAGRSIPSILITAFPEMKERERAHDAGVVCYLSKPFKDDELLACIQSAIAPRLAGGGQAS